MKFKSLREKCTVVQIINKGEQVKEKVALRIKQLPRKWQETERRPLQSVSQCGRLFNNNRLAAVLYKAGERESPKELQKSEQSTNRRSQEHSYEELVGAREGSGHNHHRQVFCSG